MKHKTKGQVLAQRVVTDSSYVDGVREDMKRKHPKASVRTFVRNIRADSLGFIVWIVIAREKLA
jgi:hypothetical protein